MKKVVAGIVALFAVLCIALVIFNINVGNKQKEIIIEDLYQELDLEAIETETDNVDEESGIILEDDTVLTDFKNLMANKVQMQVSRIDEKEITFIIDSPDLRTILAETASDQEVIEALQQDDCPMTKSEVSVNYMMEDDEEYAFSINEDLMKAIYGDMDELGMSQEETK